ncbi:MAG: hypothetical protein R3Y45_00950 [Bacillota bacterium]
MYTQKEYDELLKADGKYGSTTVLVIINLIASIADIVIMLKLLSCEFLVATVYFQLILIAMLKIVMCMTFFPLIDMINFSIMKDYEQDKKLWWNKWMKVYIIVATLAIISLAIICGMRDANMLSSKIGLYLGGPIYLITQFFLIYCTPNIITYVIFLCCSENFALRYFHRKNMNKRFDITTIVMYILVYPGVLLTPFRLYSLMRKNGLEFYDRPIEVIKDEYKVDDIREKYDGTIEVTISHRTTGGPDILGRLFTFIGYCIVSWTLVPLIFAIVNLKILKKSQSKEEL